jgi:hypothetical protein
MREQLNSNPLIQAVVIGVLLLSAGVFLLTMGGGEEEAATTEATVQIAGTDASGSASGATPGEAVEGAVEAAAASASAGAVPIPPEVLASAAPPPPKKVTTAFDANQIVALLFVRTGGIDDQIIAPIVRRLDSLQGVASFVVPVGEIARYAAITQGVEVERVPALVVLRPKRLDKGVPSASVTYGFQSPESITQAIVDAGYKGPTLDYHP